MAESNLKKNARGHNYKYTDLAQIHEYLEDNGYRYYQYIERIDTDDYIYTVPIIDGEEKPPRRGCRVAQATLRGVNNPAQEQGSALTYARRYSLLMAFGLATTDDDAQIMSTPKYEASPEPPMTRQELENKLKALCEVKDFNIRKFFEKQNVEELSDMPTDKIIGYINWLKEK